MRMNRDINTATIIQHWIEHHMFLHTHTHTPCYLTNVSVKSLMTQTQPDELIL